jgi:hypothetical protein
MLGSDSLEGGDDTHDPTHNDQIYEWATEHVEELAAAEAEQPEATAPSLPSRRARHAPEVKPLHTDRMRTGANTAAVATPSRRKLGIDRHSGDDRPRSIAIDAGASSLLQTRGARLQGLLWAVLGSNQ